MLDCSLIRILSLNYINYSNVLSNLFYFIVTGNICITIFLFINAIKKSIYKFRIEIKKELFLIDTLFYSQIAIVLLLIIISITIIYFQFYKNIFLYLIVLICHAISIYCMCWLSYKFIKWVRNNKDTIIFSYAVSFIFFSLFMACSLITYIQSIKMSKDTIYIPYQYSITYG